MSHVSSIFYDRCHNFKFELLPNLYDDFIHRSQPIKTFVMFSINNNNAYINILVKKWNLTIPVINAHMVCWLAVSWYSNLLECIIYLDGIDWDNAREYLKKTRFNCIFKN